MRSEENNNDIEKVKKAVIDLSLKVTSILGIIVFVISFLSRWIKGSITFSIYIESFVLLSLILITNYKSKLSNETKALIIILLLLLFSLSDSLFYGLFSSARIYLILVPFFSIIYFTVKRTIILLLSSVLTFMLIGYFHHTGVLQIPSKYVPNIYVFAFYPWIINGIHISIVASVIFILTIKFFTSFSNLIIDLESHKKIIIEKELIYSEIFNSTSEAIFIHDAKTGKILDVNNIMLQMFGFENKEQVLNSTLSIISTNIPPYTEIEAFEKMQKTLTHGPQLFYWMAKKQTGELIWIEVSLRNSKIAGESRILSVVRDITERKKTEQALADSELRFRQMSDLLPQTIIETDVNGSLTYINKIGYHLFKIEENDILNGINIFSFLDEEQRQKAMVNFNKTMHGEPVDSNYYNVHIKDGSLFPIQIFSIYFESETIKGTRAIVVDIRERLEAEKQLRESQQQFMTLAEMSPVGIFRTKPDGYTSYVNPKWTELSGISSEEALGEGWLRAVHPDDRDIIRQNWESVTKSKNNSIAEYRFLHMDGSIIWVLGNAVSEIVDGNLNGYIGTLTDITEKKLNEMELEKYRNQLELLVKERTNELGAANEELQMSNEELKVQQEALEITLENLQKTQNQLIQSEKMASLGILAAGIAHEINNPLNFISGGLYGIESFVNEYFPSHMQDIEPMLIGMKEGVHRAAAIVSSLNHYSRKNDSVFSSCDIHYILDNCLVMLHNQYKNRIDIQKRFTEIPFNFEGSEGKLHQAFLNILVNAVQAIEGNGEIKILTKIEKEEVHIEINDTGHGISQENLKMIFDPFFTTKDPGKGTGLGLSITYNIIQEHHGSIEFDSKEGQGTKVIIRLPLNSTTSN